MLFTVLPIVVAIYLIHLAVVLWRHGRREISGRAPVTRASFSRPLAVAVATWQS
jgi:hypothetical protein